MCGRFDRLPDSPGILDRSPVRYAISGGVGLVVNVTLLVVFVEWLGFSTVVAPVVSLLLALTVSLVLVDRWVFRQYPTDDLRSSPERGATYYLTMGTGKVLNYVMYLLLTQAGVPYPLAWILGAAVVFVGTFMANRRLWRWSASLE